MYKKTNNWKATVSRMDGRTDDAKSLSPHHNGIASAGVKSMCRLERLMRLLSVVGAFCCVNRNICGATNHNSVYQH